MDHYGIEIIEDDFDGFLNDHIRPFRRRQRRIRNRPNYFTDFDEEEFRARFRLNKRTANYLFNLIKNSIKTKTNRNSALSPKNRLLLTLRYYATGSFLIVVGDFCGVSKATASRVVAKVSRAIANLNKTFIRFPQNKEIIIQDFFEIARFPRVIGAIDCTHVSIKSPGGENAEIYRNRKGTFSINVQTVVDAQLKILDIVARWPGASHDQNIFNNSRIKHRLLHHEFGNNVILGDKGYENTNFLLTPLHNPRSPAENLYNEAHIRTRNTVERTYGVWKNRFPVLSKKITLNLNKIQAVIVACAVLHNIAILSRENNFEEGIPTENIGEDENVPNYLNRNAENAARMNLIGDYFTSLL